MIWKIVGIDPGFTGFAVFMENGIPKTFWPSPVFDEGKSRYDWEKLVACCFEWKQLGIHAVALEALHALPSSMGGVIANFSRGLSMGAWKTAITAASLHLIEADPRTWKRFYGITGSYKEQKAMACAIAAARWPEVEWRDLDHKPKARKPCHGKAEAALIASFADSRLRIAR